MAERDRALPLRSAGVLRGGANVYGAQRSILLLTCREHHDHRQVPDATEARCNFRVGGPHAQNGMNE
ncbi:MAG TPA: hypothetical protein VGG62_07115 [Terracidiphilus sp.]